MVKLVTRRPVLLTLGVAAVLAVGGTVALVTSPSGNPPGSAASPPTTAGPGPTGGPESTTASPEASQSAGPGTSPTPASGDGGGSGGSGGSGRSGGSSGSGGIPGLPAGTGVQPGSGSSGTAGGLPITVDGRQLGADGFFINWVTGRLDGSVTHVVSLKPGTYQAVTTGRSGVTFTVTDAGTIDYDAGTAAFVSGAGTSTLTLRGAPVTIDATQLVDSSYQLNNETGVLSNTATHTLRLLPGTHEFAVPVMAATEFTVNLDGSVGYDPSLGGFLSGAGTATLTLRGFAFTIDATPVLVPDYQILHDTGTLDAKTPHAMRLLPGKHLFYEGLDNFWFSVGLDGAVGYDASQAGYLAGAGTSTLTLRGFDITIDATHLDASHYYEMDRADYLTLTNDRPHTFRWLPGQHVLNVSNTNPGVQVAENGTLVLRGNLSTYESGAGTNTLVLNGFALTVDARASSLDFTMDDEGIVYSHTTVHVLHLLPANHWYTSTMPGDNPFTFGFVLTYSGTIDFNPSQPGGSGEGTATLTITGP